MTKPTTPVKFLVRYTTVNRKDELVTKEKSFRTPEARAKFLDREDNGVVAILAFAGV